MSAHHPGETELLELAAGRLAPGPAFVAAAHLEICPSCRDAFSRLEALGGALLDSLPPARLAPARFAETLARLEENPPHPMPPAMPANDLPLAMQGCVLGRWWWIGRGVAYRKVSLPWAPDENVMLLRVAANRRVVRHSHGGAEWTLVLQGSFADQTGAYGAGDLQVEAETTWHRPQAGPAGCLCLAWLEKGLRLSWRSPFFGRASA